jgi:filamentous hemagglutinin
MPRTPTSRLNAGALRSILLAAALVAPAQLVLGANPFQWPTGTVASSPHGGSSASSPGAAAAPPGTTNPQTWLQRSATALQAVEAMQASAQAAAAAAASSVPNGMAGLQVATGSGGTPVLWQGASAPTASASSANAITITQTNEQALLQWQTFNIGKNTSLTFNQSAGGADVGDWIAFNFVRDPSGQPAQILGSLSTTNGQTNSQGQPEIGGQVYVIDANGIIFGGTAQVNAGALVASSLPINAGLIQRGLLNNPDEQFLFSALPISAGSNGPTPAFDPSVAVSGVAPAQTPFDPAGSGRTGTQYAYGNITVQAGAALTSPDSAPDVGGKVALIGPNVVNDGTITTPDGQTILAAGLQVGLAASSDPELRGLDVYVGSTSYPASYRISNAAVGTATNDGDPGAATGSGTLGNVTAADILNAAGSVLVPAGTPVPGMIEAPRADVWMAGQNVFQLGVIDSSTSVSYNGRIDLTANYDAVGTGNVPSAGTPYFLLATGTVTLGPGSVTQVLPQLSDPTTIVGASFYTLALPSEVNVQGENIDFEPADSLNPGAALLAPNATVNVDAGTWQFLAGGFNPGTSVLSTTSSEGFVYNTGAITVGAGAAIDAAGSENVSASVTENIVAVQLLSTELADSPVQRGGPLEGQTVYIDIDKTGTYDGVPWVGTAVADTSGYVGLIQHTVGELTVDGGTVNLNAGNGVALQPGSSVDVSGGWINYSGAYVQTTKLVEENGQVIDISQATPNIPYEGIYTGTSTTTDSKWGVTLTTANPVPLGEYQTGYTEGGSGGVLSITAPAMTLAGAMAGDTYAGARQISSNSISSSLEASLGNAGIDPRVWELNSLPAPAELSLTFDMQYATGAPDVYATYNPAPPDIVFQSSGSSSPAGALVLSPDLVDTNVAGFGGFGNLAIDASSDNDQLGSSGNLVVAASPAYGSITVAANPGSPSNIALQTAPGGSITFKAANIDIEGGVVAPGGKLSFTAYDFSPHNGASSNGIPGGIPAYDPDRGNFTLGAGVTLSAAGLVVDEQAVSSSGGVEPLLTSGGSIAIAGSSVSLGSGSTVNVDGGGEINTSGVVVYGAGGGVTLETGDYPNPAAYPIFTPASVLASRPLFAVGDEVNLTGDAKPLDGFSGAAGGSLSIVAPLVQIGSVATPPQGALVLSAEFFDNGGFASYTIDGVGRIETGPSGNALTDSSGNVLFYPGLYVAPGTLIYPRVQQLQIVPDGTGYASDVIDPFSYEYTPANLTFSASNVGNPAVPGVGGLLSRGDLVVAPGAVIETDPQTNPADGVNLSASTVAVLGSVIVPGGTISITGGADSSELFVSSSSLSGPLPTVDLGPESLLSTVGTPVYQADAYGRVPGEPGYLPTGTVLQGGTIVINGNIAAEAGSIINVSGSSATLDLSPTASGSSLAAGLSPQGLTFSPAAVASNAGSIEFVGQDELFVDSTLEGQAGGPTAAGGSLSISSGAFQSNSPLVPTLSVVESGPTIPAAFYGSGETAIGHPVVSATGVPLSGMGYFAASSLDGSGLASVALDGTVSFQGPVSISVAQSISVAGAGPTGGNGGIIIADGAVSLDAPYVALGQSYLAPVLPAEQTSAFSNGTPFYLPPASGAGTLTVTAGSAGNLGLIDLGNLSLQAISEASFTAAGGDVRGFGTVDIAGALGITAGQVYAPTEETFTLAAYNYNLPSDPAGTPARPGTIDIGASGSRQVPLSAGSTLNIYASVIDQDGVLQAPEGTINLGWNGTGTAPIDTLTNAAVPVAQNLTLGPSSITSVSAAVVDSVSGQNIPIPYGLIYEDNSWIDPSGANITSEGPPAKSVTLSAANVSVESGAVVNTYGGGDLFAYEFIPGTGGTNDILSSSSTSFAVIPGYEAGYAPYASFNPSPSTSSVTNYASGDLGYISAGSNGQSQLAVGEQVYLNLQNGLGTQAYTLLPARYALLPGAYLVTPLGTAQLAPAGAAEQPDGSYVVTGYAFNGFDPSMASVYSEFDVALGTPANAGAASSPASVVRSRALYTDYFADGFFEAGGQGAGSSVVQVPADGGDLEIAATTALTLEGAVNAQAATGGEGGLVDIASTENIVINDTGNGGSSPAAGTLYLSSTELSNFGAGSLLVGGTRTGAGTSAAVDVTAGSVTVDNPGDPLTGSDIILAANQNLTVSPGSEVESTGTASASAPAETLLVSDTLELQPAATASGAGQASTLTLSQGGTAVSLPQGTNGDKIDTTVNATVTLANGSTEALTAGKPTALSGSCTVTLSGPGKIVAIGTGAPIPVTLGDGVLLRVSNDSSATSTRIGVASSTAPTLQVGAGATISGASVTIDSTDSTTIDPTANLGGALSLSSGQISLVLNSSLAGDVAPGSLVLTGSALSSLETNATALALLSYSSIDTYGAGQIGTTAFTSLSLHAAELRGFDLGSGGQVTFTAQTVSLDNSQRATDPGPVPGNVPGGTLSFNAGTVELGANTLSIDQFANVNLTASGGIVAEGPGGSTQGSGALSVSGNLTMTAPILTATAGTVYSISSGGNLALNAPASGAATVSGGLGAQLALTGSSVAVNSEISAPSGQLSLTATGAAAGGGNVTVGGLLDAGGTAQTFSDATNYTSGGTVNLASDEGSVVIAPGGSVSVAAQAGGGEAGSLSVSAPAGAFTVASAAAGASQPTLDALNGQGGTFSLDVQNLSDAAGNATTLLSPLEAALSSGGFSQSQSLRVRGSDVTVDGTAKSSVFNLSTDTGSISVTGTIDASGQTGGTINLDAGDSVTLENGSTLTVQGQNFNDAGEGGSVTLQAGARVGGTPFTGKRLRNEQFAAGVPVVDIESGSTVDLAVVNDHPLELNPGGSASGQASPGSITVPAGTAVFFPDGTPGSDELALSVAATVTTAGGAAASYPAGAILTLAPGSTVALASSGTMSFGGGTGGSIPLALPSRFPDGAPLTVATTNATDLSPYNSIGSLLLVAPQVMRDVNGTMIPVDVEIDPIAGTIENGPGGFYSGAGALYGEGSLSLVAEGLEVFNLTSTGGVITQAVQQEVQNNAAEFAGGLMLLDAFGDTERVAGSAEVILPRLADGNLAFLEDPNLLQIRPGAEIVNTSGNIVLQNTWDFAAGATYTGSGNFNAGGDPALASNWSLSGMYYRFGPSINQLSQPGYLTLRASGNVVFGMDPNTGGPVSLNDEFAGFDGSDTYSLWQAIMLPAGVKSWSFNIVAGADLSAADASQVIAGDGSVLMGQGVPSLPANPVSVTASFIIPNNYQTIRTGSGNIGIYAGGNVEFLNNLATVYTSGTPTAPISDFNLPAEDAEAAPYPVTYTSGGGSVIIDALGSIEHLTPDMQPDSSMELPVNWLYRQGAVNPDGQFVAVDRSVESTSWWTDYSNFFEGVGALGGGNVTLTAGGSIVNVDAAIPTNERTTYQAPSSGAATADTLAADQPTLELGGGDLAVDAGGNISGGVYYVERGQGSLSAGDSILTNIARAVVSPSAPSSVTDNPVSWLPTTLFLGQGSFAVSAENNVLLGPVANPFLLPEAVGNGGESPTYFSTYATGDSVRVSSLAGFVTIKDDPDDSSSLGSGGTAALLDWLNLYLNYSSSVDSLAFRSEPWLSLAEQRINLVPFDTVVGVMPSSLYVTAFSGDVDLVGSITLSPSPNGQFAAAAADSINGVQPNIVSAATDSVEWGSSMINLSDADPTSIPGVGAPSAVVGSAQTDYTALVTMNALFDESGSLTGNFGVIQTKDDLHAPGPLHAGDPNPVELFANSGDISGLTMFAGKSVQLVAAKDISDIALYIQNDNPGDISEVIAGGNITLYDPDSPLRMEAGTPGNQFVIAGSTSVPASGTPTAGDIQIGGPGTLEVLAGGSINLGVGPEAPDGTSVGITSIGNSANPRLPFGGADLVIAAGITGLGGLAEATPGLADSGVDFSSFMAQYVDPSTAGANAARYLPELAAVLGVTVPAGGTPEDIWQELIAPYSSEPAAQMTEQEDLLGLDAFYVVLRDAGRDYNNPASQSYGSYANGYAAIQALLPGTPTSGADADIAAAGSLSLSTRLIETTNGGDIGVFTPIGQVTVGLPTDPQKPDQGILTEDGGNISIVAQNDVDVGTSRIFTLHGGNEIIWSTLGSIAAGSGSKTVHAAPPTRVIIDPQSGDVQNDLAGLATGSGIGVLATLTDVAPADVDLIAPVGTVNAGDAGIRASGDISIAALHVVNAFNIQSGGTTTGVPVVAPPNIAGLTSASSTTAATSSAAATVANQQQSSTATQEAAVPSIFDVEVLGYGGGDDFTQAGPAGILGTGQGA